MLRKRGGTVSALLFVALSIGGALSHLEAYTGREPSSAASSRFAVTLAQKDGPSLKPHIYTTESPDADLAAIHPPNFCLLHGAAFCRRSMNWVEFGVDHNDTTTISIMRLDGHIFPVSTRILPVSYNLTVTLSPNRSTATVQVKGSRLHFFLEHGGAPSAAEDSSFAHMMLIFIGGRDPTVPPLSADHTLVFGPGVHHIPGDGILQLPDKVSTVVLQRGAWFEGRINVTRGSSGPVQVLGHGIMEGSRFRYHGSNFADDMRFVEIQYDRPIFWNGPTVVHPQGHAFFAPPNSVIECYRMLGWLFNEDGIWIGPNVTLKHSFIRTNDDSIRLYAGELDDFHNLPGPVRGTAASNIRVTDTVVSQMFNGSPIQVGWENSGIVDSSIDNLDVTGAEWYWRPGNVSLEQNNAVVSLSSPVYDETLREQHRNITVSNLRVDTSVGRVVGLGLFGTPTPSSVRGFTLCNTTIRRPLQWLHVENSTEPHPGDNFVIAQSPDVMEDIVFSRVMLEEKLVQSDADWHMTVQGNVTDVHYGADNTMKGA